MSTPLLPNIASAVASAVQYQREDAAWLADRKRAVIGHKTGLGKTFISLLAWDQWPDVNRAFIIGSSSAIGTWRRVLRQWGGVEPTILKGLRDPGWESARSKTTSGIWLMTAATLRILVQAEIKLNPKFVLHADLLVCDELHKYLRNKTETWKSVKKVQSRYFIGATATWASKGPQDLYPVLNIIDHTLFSSYWRFVSTWCHVNDASFGKEIIGTKNSAKLKEYLAMSYYRQRTWKEVGSQFLSHELKDEPIVRRMVVVELDEQQNRLYSDMDARNECRVGNEFILAENSLAKLTKLLQLAMSPQLLLPQAEPGALVTYACERVAELQSCVVFIPFKGLAQICADHLRSEGYAGTMYTLYGGTSIDDCDATIADWRRTKGVVFCTISYAQSFALDAADHCYFLGYDWDPNNNIQAEGRMRRFDSEFSVPCLATYLVAGGTVYEKVKEVINGKVNNVRSVLEGYGC